MKKLLFICCLLMLFQQADQLKAQTIGWTRLSFNPSYGLNAVHCINKDTVVAVGNNGYIVRTIDGGTHWDSIPSNTSNTLYKVTFLNNAIGYACGTKGTVLKTSNGGQSWTNIGINSNLDFLSMSFINADTGWVAGGEGTFLVQSGDKGVLMKTLNGGTNWNIDSTYNATVSSVCFLDNDTGYIAICKMQNSSLKRTNNGGISYELIQQDTFPTSGVFCYSNIKFTNTQTGYFVKSNNYGGIFKTDNYGSTWSSIEMFLYPILNTFIIDSCNLFYNWWDNSTGSGSGRLIGDNFCLNNKFDSSNIFINNFYLIDKDYGFCVGSEIYKRGIVQSVNEPEIQKMEVFPNPFQDKFSIRPLPISSIFVYDIFGKLVFEKTNPYSIENEELDLSTLPKGLYFLTIKSGNRPVQNIKLIKL